MLHNIISLPISDPIAIFFIVLLIILSAPLFDRIKVPQIIGLILAGLLLGPHGLNVLAYDDSFKLFGKVGILYIMFLAGLEIDMNTFKSNKNKGITFGAITFVIPMVLGSLANHFVLSFDWHTSMLLSTIYAAHTLIAFPIVGKLGVTKSRSISIVMAGTVLAVAMSLLLLTVLTAQGGVEKSFIVRFVLFTTLFLGVVFWAYPRILRFFLRKYNNAVTQYIFILSLVFAASLLAQLAGLEGVLGAFMAGLVINRFVPSVSPLMIRISFVGNALFIPFFLISIGMFIDITAFVSSGRSAFIALVMSTMAIGTKWLSAKCTALCYKLSRAEENLIFGLTTGKAATTLAVVMIGYNLQLFDYEVLNAVVVLILVVCTVSSMVTEHAARTLAMEEVQVKTSTTMNEEKLLVPLSNADTMEGLLELGNLLKEPINHRALYALQVVRENTEEFRTSSERIIEQAKKIAAASDNKLNALFRQDASAANGIAETFRGEGITDIILGVHRKAGITDSLWGGVLGQVVTECSNGTVFIYQENMPMSTIRRIFVAVPVKAEYENGFAWWLRRIYNIAQQTGAEVCFCTNKATASAIATWIEQGLQQTWLVQFHERVVWEDFVAINELLGEDDLLVAVSARQDTLSYNPQFDRLPMYLHKHFSKHSWIVLFPAQPSTHAKE